MEYNDLEIDLRKVLTQLDRWRLLGDVPPIERGIALERLQHAYELLLDLPCRGAEGVASGGDVEAESVPEPAEEDSLGAASAVGGVAGVGVVALGPRLSTEQEEPVDSMPTAHADSDVDAGEGNGSEPLRGEPAEEPELHPSASGTPHTEESPASKSPLFQLFGIEVSPYTRNEIIDTLFHGNVETFEEEVKKLDAMGSLEEALVYIGETYHWIPENAATVKFIDLLETRFDH